MILNFVPTYIFRELISDDGLTFTFDTAATDDTDLDNIMIRELDFMNFPGVENHLNPLEMTFEEQKMHMNEVFEGVWKKVVKEAPPNAKAIDFTRHRITYHRNFFMEGETAPFDSTYLNGKADVICNDIDTKLIGFTEALSTMKEGETAMFIITYEKMFRAHGCMPRVQPCSNIFAELKVLKVEEIGDVESFNKIDEFYKVKTFEEAKNLVKEARLRAKDYYANGNIESAIRIYQKIQQMLEFAKPENDNEKNERDEILIHVLSNLATCFNVSNQPRKAISIISQVESKCSIENQPKILFAKGKALRLLCEYKEAMVVFKKSKKLLPNDKMISKELEKLDKCIADNNEFTKRMSSMLIKN